MGRWKVFVNHKVFSSQAQDNFVPLVSLWYWTDGQRTEDDGTGDGTDAQRMDDDGMDDGTDVRTDRGRRWRLRGRHDGTDGRTDDIYSFKVSNMTLGPIF